MYHIRHCLRHICHFNILEEQTLPFSVILHQDTVSKYPAYAAKPEKEESNCDVSSCPKDDESRPFHLYRERNVRAG